MATVLLILMGGIVTSTGSGLAVPDWPTTFGYNMFTFPLSKMVGGVFFEHTHRLLGSLVGVLTILTVVSIWHSDGRDWLRWLSIAALALVIIQGVLGGLRVVLIKLDLAIVHACVAQLFFGIMVSIATFTSRVWHQLGTRISGIHDLRKFGCVAIILIYLQTIFGAVLRHTGTHLDAHLLFAVLVTIQIIWLAIRVTRKHAQHKELVRPINLLLILLILQVALGVGSYLAKYTLLGNSLAVWVIIAFTTLHVLVGAMLFAAAVALTLRIFRFSQFERHFSHTEILSEQLSP